MIALILVLKLLKCVVWLIVNNLVLIQVIIGSYVTVLVQRLLVSIVVTVHRVDVRLAEFERRFSLLRVAEFE